MSDRKKLSIADAKKVNPFQGEPKEHPFAAIVEDFLRSMGIVPEDVRRGVPGETVWSFLTGSGLSIAFRLYKTPPGEVFFHLECAFGRVPEGGEDLISEALLRQQYSHYFPLWFSLGENNLAVLLCRSFCDGITPEHFLLRLDSMLIYGAQMKEHFGKSEYGLQPLPRNWFKGNKAA